MALHNRVRVNTATTGTGVITLGAALSSWRTFAQGGVINAELVSYVIEDGANFEYGRGTYTSSGTTLSRTTILGSSNAGAAISLSGSATVFLGPIAEDFTDFVASTITTTGAATVGGNATVNGGVITVNAASAGAQTVVRAVSTYTASFLADVNGGALSVSNTSTSAGVGQINWSGGSCYFDIGSQLNVRSANGATTYGTWGSTGIAVSGGLSVTGNYTSTNGNFTTTYGTVTAQAVVAPTLVGSGGAFATSGNTSVGAYLDLSYSLTFRDNNSASATIASFNIAGSQVNSNLYPSTDNARSLGTSSLRWSVVYAGTGTINTSDAREKTKPQPIDDALLDAWGGVKWVQFQFLDAVAEKGEDGARIHTGVVAQQVRDALKRGGVDGLRYGVLCYDEWKAQKRIVEPAVEAVEGVPGKTDEGGNVLTWKVKPVAASKEIVVQEARPAGNRWGIRYDLAQAVEAAYQRRRADRMEARLEALERRAA